MERDELLALGIEESVAERILEEQEKMRDEYEKNISYVKQENEIERLLIANGAKNLKAVRALIGEGDIESVKNEIENLKKGEDTKFLFETRRSFAPARSGEKLPDANRNDFEARLIEARKSGNTLEAIRIKQQAAGEGIMLL